MGPHCTGIPRPGPSPSASWYGISLYRDPPDMGPHCIGARTHWPCPLLVPSDGQTCSLVDATGADIWWCLLKHARSVQVGNTCSHFPYTKTDKGTNKKWIVYNYVEVHRDGHHHGFPLGSMLIYRYLCLYQSLCLSRCRAV